MSVSITHSAARGPEPAPGQRGPAMLRVSGVAKRFGGTVALDGVDWHVERGSLTGLIGPNGAGKSTLFNVVTGLTKPDSGRVHIGATETTNLALAEVARLGVGRAFQTPRGFASMTLMESLCLVPKVRGESLLSAFLPWGKARNDVRAKAKAVIRDLGIAELADRCFGELSGGEMRLAEIARHLMRDVEILLLDEPTAGVHPDSQDQLAATLRELRDNGMTIVIVEHNLRFVYSLVDSITAMVAGRVLSTGTPEQVWANQAVIDAYLGEGGTQ